MLCFINLQINTQGKARLGLATLATLARKLKFLIKIELSSAKMK